MCWRRFNNSTVKGLSLLTVLGATAWLVQPPIAAQGQGKGASNLQERVAALEELLAHVRLEQGEINDLAGPHLIIEGCNVHVRSGSGATDDLGQTLGAGNLIVGYNEEGDGVPLRTGSHNLVVGRGHAYVSFGGLVAGESNSVTVPACSVTGGLLNNAAHEYASVSGGLRNEASGPCASVSGGWDNIASGFSSSVSGGNLNEATRTGDSVSGGCCNIASGGGASVSGGLFNEASAGSASVSGGHRNRASAQRASVSGGDRNEASGLAASVSGGESNHASGDSASVNGGKYNTATHGGSTISGGFSNTSEAVYDHVP